MSTFFSILMALAILTVVASLGLGLFAMAKGTPALSNKMMRWRVGLQALAILFFILALTSK